jgi:hypothetical protein
VTTYVPYSSIPVLAIQDIKDIIENDEGGWVLTSNKDDPDGGWTYAGITAKNWQDFYSFFSSSLPQDLNRVRTWFNGLSDVAKEQGVYRIYYSVFYLPLKALLNAEEELYPYELSCAINCGNSVALEVHKIAAGPGDGDYETVFLREWTRHYVKLVVANAEAWRQYALALTSTHSLIKPASPATLRAIFLEGWFNRVERYRSSTVTEELSGLVS